RDGREPLPLHPPPADTAVLGAPQPDWGTRLGFPPYVVYSGATGVVIGGGPVYTRYGFRRHPHALQLSAQLRYAPLHGDFGLHAAAHYRSRNPDVSYLFEAHASQIEQLRFHGFGNETHMTGGARLYRARLTEIYAAPALRLRLAPAAHLALGPVLRYTEPQLRPESPLERLRPYGPQPKKQSGIVVSSDLEKLWASHCF
ncbi:MAG TPA: hypothetical protein VGR27_09375, partial [Longimicrobiaceae bacterium]|nr:hypothetical protein [Longimicrobiaceae bacterium]